jgi:two-component system sensor histidine kinase KdpD
MKSLAAARAREAQNTRLYELSQALAVSTTEPDILRKLADYILTAFKADQVEILVKMKAGTFSVCVPENIVDPTQPKVKPTFSMPFQGSHHLDGEIRLWRLNRPIKPYGEKLLNIYTQQGIQALERKIIAEQVRQTELLQATEKLQSSLLNSISHDLRTPLVSITGALSSLQEKSLVIDQKARGSMLVTALREAERLNRLVGNLLSMTRLEADAMPLYKEPCDLEDIIGSAIEQLGDRAANREILVNIPRETTLILLDFSLFEQVLVNVLENAIKYSLPDTAIEIHVKEEAGWTQIDISDRGEGIPAEDLEHVFEKFFRVQRKLNTPGSGLGLAICKGIVEAHGGCIHAYTREGGGTILSISVPREVIS